MSEGGDIVVEGASPAGAEPGDATAVGRDALEQRLATLSPEKRALVERRLMSRRPATAKISALTARPRHGPVPLSFVQELMWLVHRLSPGTNAYNSSGARRVRGPLDVDALQRALTGVVDRHETLRTSFEVLDRGPVQVINDDLSVALRLIDAPGASEYEVADMLRAEVRRPFDLSVPPLLRTSLIRLAVDDHVFVTVANHIIWDGWSRGVFFRELAEFYDAFVSGRRPQLPELAVQYRDFAEWQREWLRGDVLDRQLAYWREQLADAPALLALPTDHRRPPVQTFEGARQSVWVPAEVLDGLKALSHAQDVTLFMTLLACWNVLLHRYSGQDDIIVGSPIAGRNRVELERLIGYFNNTLVMRSDCSGNPTFVELLRRVREMALGAFAHQDVSVEQIIQELALQRDLSYSPVFQTLFVLQNTTREKLALTGVTMEALANDEGTAKFDLTLGVAEHDGRLHATFEYNTDLFEAETVNGMRRHFSTLLRGIVADPQCRLSDLPLLTPAEEEQLVIAGTPAPVPEAPLHDLVSAQTLASPDRLAVVGGEASLRYGELESRAAGLAERLRELGVERGSPVGLFVERAPEMVVALLAILKAGGACLPIDPAYPRERIAFMVEDAGVPVLLTQPHLLDRVRDLGPEVAVLGDESPSSPPAQPRTEPVPVEPTDLAYVVYTSGSTGQPKGVLLEHRGLVNQALAGIRGYDLGPEDRVLQFSSISFDISIEEVFCTLLAGATLVLRTDDMPLGGAGLIDWLERERITVMDLPTAFWHEWVRDLSRLALTPPSTLRLVIVGGEKALPETYAAWRRVAGDSVRWINTYGPTETSVVATAFAPVSSWRPEEGRELPIGQPIHNTTAWVLDQAGRPVPDGLPGELYIGGAGVARGYLNRPELSAERFVTIPSPQGAVERAYRTGDVVRRLVDGSLEFVGRTDQQVKLRGFRIEPGEIESVLVEHPSVSEALVALRDNLLGEPSLIGYAVVDDRSAPALPLTLRGFLADRLPAYMVPSAVVPLDELPLTPHGKIDRDALPLPAEPDATIDARPADDVERRLLEIWNSVLGLRVVGVHDDFFQSGGHSMLAVRMFSLLEQEFGARLPLATLMRSPTVAALANELRSERDGSEWNVVVPLKPDGTGVPLFLIHEPEGTLLCYRDLIKHLPEDQPAYGIQGVGVDRMRVPPTRIEDIARISIDEIRMVQPHGPYLLAGFCFGGVVAYEMAHQLEEEGERVAFVGLIDANPFGRRGVTTLAQRSHRHWRELLALSGAERARFVRQTTANVRIRIRSATRWWISRRLYLDRGKPLPDWLYDLYTINARAATTYNAPTYRGSVTLFRAGDTSAEKKIDRRQQWQEVIGGGVVVRDVSGDGVAHRTLLSEPHVDRLAEHLNSAIAEGLAANVK